MVATRRGVHGNSSAKAIPDQSSHVPATPSTDRRTRSVAKQVENPTCHVLVETRSHLDGGPPGSPPTSQMKRCNRALRLHSPEQPCTPVSSIHEADVSDLESGCSALSDIEPPATRTKGKRRPTRAAVQRDEELSEAESCSSAVSASKAGQVTRRSTRKIKAPQCDDSARAEAGEVDQLTETLSSSSVASESRRITRSQRKTAPTSLLARQQIEDSEVSDSESCTSMASGTKGHRSTSRRAAKPRSAKRHIPFHLDEASEPSSSPARGRPTRAARAKAPATVDDGESLSPDSDGFESGPTYSITTRRRGKTQSKGPRVADSGSELTDRGTPCSSRTGSGNSGRRVPVSRNSVTDLGKVMEKATEPLEEDGSLNDSRLESTLITEDADCTLLEERESRSLEEEPEAANRADVATSEADGKIMEKVVVSGPAVIVEDQQGEPSAGNEGEDAPEVEMMQETIHSSELFKRCQSVTVTCKRLYGIPEEKGRTMQAADVGTGSSHGEKATDVEAVVETQTNVEEKMEVVTPSADAQRVVESIQVTSGLERTITVDSDSERQPRDVSVRNTKVISLLDSSDDEYDEEERDASGGEANDGAFRSEGPSKSSGAEAASVAGLFMIDTRPGQEADEQYYRDRRTEDQEAAKREEADQEQEFVDEEGEDEDDDDDEEDARILFSGRNPQLKELSTRIDPGIRMKELGGLYIHFGGSESKVASSSLQKRKEKKIQDEVMKKSVIGPEFEKKDAVPPYSESKQALKLKHRAEREKSTGDAWFNMKAPEITQELKGDLKVLKMRGSADPKRFYKKNDRDGFPKYFQVGTVVDTAVDFYHSRVPKKERKRTMVEELLADAEFRHKNKKKYQQIVAEKAAHGAGKRNKKKNKFHKK